jgi:hypothetical protein
MSKIVLNSREITYLSRIINTDKLIGLENLTENISNNQKDSGFEEVKRTLNFKNYIAINEKEQVSIDISLYILLNTCSKPETFMSFEKIDKEMGSIKCNYYSYNSICIRMIEKTNGNEYIFQFIINKDKMRKELNSFLNDKNKSFDTFINDNNSDFEKNVLNIINNNTLSMKNLNNILPGFFGKFSKTMLLFHSINGEENFINGIYYVILENKLFEFKEKNGEYKFVSVPRQRYCEYVDRITKYLMN